MQLPRAPIEVIPANEYRRVRWRNGLGWTREIVRMPDHDTFDWRLSIAEIEQDAAFSAFPGVDRELVLLSGNGLRLRFGDGRMQELLPPHGSARFAGDEDVQGELVAGPTTDFNLMWRRDAIEASLWRRPLVGAMVVFVDPREPGRCTCSLGRHASPTARMRRCSRRAIPHCCAPATNADAACSTAAARRC
jgi:hypothetical protein